MEADTDRTFSELVFRALDVLGYSSHMVKQRQTEYQNIAKSYQTFYQQHKIASKYYSIVIAGSRADGLCGQFESDLDIMQVLSDVMCTEDCSKSAESCLTETGLSASGVKLRDSTVTFYMERKSVSEGYTLLRLAETKNMREELKGSLYKNKQGDCYLSSDFFMTEMRKTVTDSPLSALLNRSFQERAGPAIPSKQPTELQSIPLKQDLVFALPCKCDTIYNQWANRPRKHGWPPSDLIVEIGTLDAHVVPVGFKHSTQQYLEWRITFTLAEIALIHSLNETLMKLYRLIKLVIKQNINPIDTDIMTSYMIKNIILWLAELCPQEHFQNTHLVKLVHLALTVMRECILKWWLPSFMIPKRNLLAAVDKLHADDVLDILTKMLERKESLLMDCEILRQEIKWVYEDPKQAQKWANKRDETEHILFQIISMTLEDPQMFQDVCNSHSSIGSIAAMQTNSVVAPLIEEIRRYLKHDPKLRKNFVMPSFLNISQLRPSRRC